TGLRATGAAPGPAGEGEFRGGLAAQVVLPEEGGPEVVVVVVPGGGWRTANPAGLLPLAEHLTGHGAATVTITYRTASTGAAYPVPAQDVACAVAFAADQVPEVPVVVLGHSAGAHLAALVALEPGHQVDCPYPERSADAVVGLAGPYDVAATPELAEPLFGVELDQDPQAWADGNPLTWVQARPEVPFLLVHGQEDAVVLPGLSEQLAAALTAAGHEVQTVLLPGVDHLQVIHPEVAGDLVVDWLTELGPASP
uniref:alpha/beta hydrolase family protein n=1 Tax=Actinotalea sp. C106 TaxID=2908644 RepID=UPI0020293B8A